MPGRTAGTPVVRAALERHDPSLARKFFQTERCQQLDRGWQLNLDRFNRTLGHVEGCQRQRVDVNAKPQEPLYSRQGS